MLDFLIEKALGVPSITDRGLRLSHLGVKRFSVRDTQTQIHSKVYWKDLKYKKQAEGKQY